MISLIKIKEQAPALVSLIKPLTVQLEKRNLQNTVARVALVLDISGSMNGRYKDGTVQEIVNKTLPLAVQFDDDGSLDFWYYGTNPCRMPTVNLDNYANTVQENWRDVQKKTGGRNNEPLVMQEVISEYQNSRLPAYVLFITDGGVNLTGQIKRLLVESSRLPIFWQFVGVGGRDYGILENLDVMQGRYIDNANFFSLDDFRSVPNDELYSRLLSEFPAWLKLAKSKNII